jgi:phosphoenolpyruvate carboxylase
LIGYSDGDKEGGLCASRFAAHEAQRALAQVLAAAGERHVVVHARGGSIARGGGRIDALIKAAPAGATNGVLRFTEQGEAVHQSYGLRPIAMRTLERAFSALGLVTASSQHGALSDSPSYLDCARTIAKASLDAYRKLLREPDFNAYFHSVTPVDVIERMQIGSRSIHRADESDLRSLLPVPWVFAWTQTRHMLPGWYGAGSGLKAAVDEHGLPQLREAYGNCFFLRNLLDDIETMLARADLDIAQAYDVLVSEPLRRFSAAICAEYSLASRYVTAVKGTRALLDTEPTLQRSIQLRNPYVDPMNLMQVDLLQRWRANDRRDPDLFAALLASISGIAQGLQSTG